jgi:hypothetical protein
MSVSTLAALLLALASSPIHPPAYGNVELMLTPKPPLEAFPPPSTDSPLAQVVLVAVPP